MLGELMQYLASEIDNITYDESGVTSNIFQDVLPAEPDIAVMVKGSGGFPRDMALVSYFEPTVQIIVRGTRDPRVARGLINEIIETIGVLGSQKFVNGGNWYVVKCQAIQSAGIPIGIDDNNRHRFSANFELEIKQL